MLVKSRKDIATDIARELLQAGVLFGEELEQYIKKGTAADITFKDQAEKTFETDILETLIEFYNIKGWENTSEKLAYEVYACRGFKRKSCPCTFMNLDLFHKMMNKKIEQMSLI